MSADRSDTTIRPNICPVCLLNPVAIVCNLPGCPHPICDYPTCSVRGSGHPLACGCRSASAPKPTRRPSNLWPPDSDLDIDALRAAAKGVGKEFWFNEAGTPDVYSGPDKVAVCEARSDSRDYRTR